MAGWRARWSLPALAVAALTLVAGLGLFFFGSGALRGFGADVIVVVHLTAALAGLGIGRAPARLAFVGLLSVGLEALQALHLVGAEAPWILHLLLGSTFDPLDLLAYAIGLVVSAALERAWRPTPPREEAIRGSAR